MKRIKSFKLFESHDQTENVIQEIEDILISGGIKDMGCKFEINNLTTLPLIFSVEPMINRFNIYIDLGNFTIKNLLVISLLTKKWLIHWNVLWNM